MASTPVASPRSLDDRSWHIVGRWHEYEGEARANLLRVIGLVAFYGIHLLNYRGLHLGFLQLPAQAGVSAGFHRAVTALAIAWTLVAFAVHLCLARRYLPAALKYASTAADLVFLTAILMLADGPRSPLVAGYFLIVILSGLRFHLNLVRGATAGAIASYLVLSGFARWFTERDLRVPRYQQLIVLVALALSGVILGQILRRARAAASDYAERRRAA